MSGIKNAPLLLTIRQEKKKKMIKNYLQDIITIININSNMETNKDGNKLLIINMKSKMFFRVILGQLNDKFMASERHQSW